MEHRGAGLNTGTRGLRLEPMYLGLTTEIALVLLNDYKKKSLSTTECVHRSDNIQKKKQVES